MWSLGKCVSVTQRLITAGCIAPALNREEEEPSSSTNKTNKEEKPALQTLEWRYHPRQLSLSHAAVSAASIHGASQRLPPQGLDTGGCHPSPQTTCQAELITSAAGGGD